MMRNTLLNIASAVVLPATTIFAQGPKLNVIAGDSVRGQKVFESQQCVQCHSVNEALPPALVKGSISGMLARTFARMSKLAWDMEARTVELTVTSAKEQDLTLIAQYGIRSNYRARRVAGKAASGWYSEDRGSL